MKKWHYVLLLILLIGGIAYGVNHFIKQHFKENLIYYTHHLPHAENSYPMVALLLDYYADTDLSLSDLDQTDAYNSDVDGISMQYHIYQKSNPDSVSIMNVGYRGTDPTRNAYFVGLGVEEKVLTLNINAKLINITEERITANDHEELKTDLEQFFAPLIAQAEEPEMNLQWLFNFYYAERFR